MKKLLLLLTLLITPIIGHAVVDYYDVQHFKIVPDTPTVRNDWYMRGSFHIVKSTYIIDAADCPIIISFRDDGTIVGSISTATFASTASTATWALDSDKLDGFDSLYFASLVLLNNEIASLTTTYLGLTAKAADSELLDGFDSLYFAIRADVASSTNSLAGSITALENSTSTLEGYIFSLWTSTQTLEAATTLNTTHRSSDGSDHSFINQDVTVTGSPTFVDVTAKWKTIDIDTTTLVINDLLRWDGTNLVRVASGTSAGTFLQQDFTWGTPSGAGDMLQSVYDIDTNSIVDNSEALNEFAYTHFVNTTTVQSIGGRKTFEDLLTVSSHVIISAGAKLHMDGDEDGDTYIQEGAANELDTFVGGALYTELRNNSFIFFKDLASTTGGSVNIGDASLYFGEVNYKTLTDRGCLGWFDGGVELQDGSIVTDIEALQAIKKHPTKQTIYGVPMMDYKTFPKVSYQKADKDGELLLRDENDEPIGGKDGVEMTSMFSIMIGAIKELDVKIQTLEQRIETLEP